MVTLSHFIHPARARLASDAASESRVPEVCDRYRRAVRWAGIVCPAEMLAAPDTAQWVRRRGVPVAAGSSTGLRQAISTGIKPMRIVLHGDAAGPLRCGVNAGVGQFVVNSSLQVAVLAHWGRRPQRVLLDVTAGPADGLAATAIASERIDLIGLHCRVDGIDRYADVVRGMVGQMAEIRWDSGVLITRLSLAPMVGECPRRMGEAIEDALDEACARFRFPRPAVALSLRWPGVRPR